MTLGLELGAGGSLEPQAVVELFVMSRRWQVELVTGQGRGGDVQGLCREDGEDWSMAADSPGRAEHSQKQ